MNDLVSLADAISLLPMRNGKKIHWLTVRRWIIKGLKGNKLAAQKVGGCWYTSQAWIDDFIRATTQTALGTQRRHPAVRRAQHLKARKTHLERYGIKSKRPDASVDYEADSTNR